MAGESKRGGRKRASSSGGRSSGGRGSGGRSSGGRSSGGRSSGGRSSGGRGSGGGSSGRRSSGGRSSKGGSGRRRGGGSRSAGPGGLDERKGRPEELPQSLPPTEFAQFELAPRLEAALSAAGYLKPTSVQEQMIPLVLDEKNVVGRSRTGTGKTAAFLIPLLALLDEVEDPSIIKDGVPRGPVRVLIVVPTRELALQVALESEKLTRFLPVRTACIYGGTDFAPQLDALKEAAVVAGTPGRLLDHIQRGTLDLSKIDAIVLDEVDRMYDLGFREDVDRLLAASSKRSQTLLTSATLNADVESLIAKHIGAHERVEIESRSLTVDEVDQAFYIVEHERKMDLLIAVLGDLKPDRCLVFVRTRFSVDRITWRLQEKGYGAELIHSGIPQRKREQILESFREGKFPLLIATDVAARGLHIEDVSHVINYDLPGHPEDYVHRVGRTARMGKRGTAVSFVTREDGALLTEIEKLINKMIRQDTFPGFEPAPREAPAAVEAPKPQGPIPGMPPWARPARRRR